VLFERQVERLRSTAIERFRERATASLHDTDKPPAELAKDFSTYIDAARNAALDYFNEKVKASLLPDDICEWNYSMPLEELYASIAGETEHFRKELLQLLMTHAKDDLEVTLR
jgi:hypothetical protein